jgi:hypothetical protein
VPATYPNLVRHAALLRNVLAVAPRIMVAAAQALLRLMLPPPGGLMVLPRTMAVGVLRLAEPPFQMGLCGMHNRKDRGTIYFVIVTAHICAVCSTRRGRGFSPLWKTRWKILIPKQKALRTSSFMIAVDRLSKTIVQLWRTSTCLLPNNGLI